MSIVKCNYALIPENRQKFIDFSAQHAKDEKFIGQYQIHRNTIPHVTLCHFEAPENQLTNIWKSLSHCHHPAFLSLNFRTLRTGVHQGEYWYLLIPTENSLLHEMYLQSFAVLKNILNINQKNYFPHLTLFNSSDVHRKNAEYFIETPLIDNFRIVITDRDRVGQSRNIIIE